MADKYQQQWEALGSRDPYWAVLTSPDKKGNKWEKSEFFQSGQKEIGKTLLTIRRMGVQLKKGAALDFGCGVGRLTLPLAERFSKVAAVDISRSMLTEASKNCQAHTNINFIHNSSQDLSVVPDESIDFLYSNIVLQHMPKDRQLVYLKEFCRVLASGGVLAVQAPSNFSLKSWQGWLLRLIPVAALNYARMLKYGRDGVMEVHTLSREKVVSVLEQEGMAILKVEVSGYSGPALKSYMYYARK